MKRNNSFHYTSRMPALSANDLIRNLIGLLAFKYQVIGTKYQLALDEKNEKKIEL